MNKSERQELGGTNEEWAVGDWTVLESWSHVIGIMLRAVDESVSAVRMSRIRALGSACWS